MHRHNLPGGLTSSFDGPGARTILGESGPYTTTMLAAKSSPSPSDPPSPSHPHPHGLHAQHHSRSQGPAHGHPASQHPQHGYPHDAYASPGSRSAQAPNISLSAAAPPPVIKRVGGKANVSSACGPCKRAHLACDVARPCRRCVNMGKEDQCEDVPHKKRGRPKVNKGPSTEPYARPRPVAGEEAAGKWRGPSQYDTPYSAITSPPPVALGALTSRLGSPPRPVQQAVPGAAADASSSIQYQSVSAPATAAGPAPAPVTTPTPELFVLFCTTELKILRATPASQALTGYLPHEFVNMNLVDFLHPSDRHLLEGERSRLIAVPYLPGHLQSNREAHAAVMACGERELMSPAVGMREPYPNQNVRILRAENNGFNMFNVRLHLGGGLGGSLWQPETLGKIYLVVSCLLISERDAPADSRRSTIPSAAAAVGSQSQAPGLPSFSSIAAAADATPRSIVDSPQPISQQQYPYPRASPGGPPTPLPPQAYQYARPQSSSAYTPSPAPPQRRSPSPSQASYRHSYVAGGYPPQPYYPPPPNVYDHAPRRPEMEEWARRGGAPPHGAPPGSAGPLPGPDYGRRAWEL